MSKTASGCGRFSRSRFAYSPVSGDLKSGIPADVLMPAPVYSSVSIPSILCSVVLAGVPGQ
jgi:hypothetical protein